MDLFQLPKETVHGKVIPKNAFDKFTNSKQKKLLSTYIKRITWTHKLSTETTNLPSKEINEIQLFLIELKIKDDLENILSMINRSIPYHIISILSFEKEIKISTIAKHNHPSKPNQSVLDCEFSTDWFELGNKNMEITLRESLEETFITFCSQITGRKYSKSDYPTFIAKEINIMEVKIRIKRLKSKIKSVKQFNQKVELNMELNEMLSTLKELVDN